MVRHGSTPGNELKRYIGRTDEPLSEKGVREVLRLREFFIEQAFPEVFPKALPETFQDPPPENALIAVSPMMRARQTAQILFEDDPASQAHFLIIPDFRECAFGTFENKNYMELSGDPAYQRWIDSNGMLPFPGGESREAFQDRCCQAFLQLYEKQAGGSAQADLPETLVIVAHGGTIMSIAERFAVDEAGNALEYYAWHIGNAQALIFETTEKSEDDHFLRRTGRIGFGEEAGT